MKTLAYQSEGIFKDKGSKFISRAFPINKEEDIKLHLEKLKKEYHTARHYCYAYRIGENGNSWRVNDDDEPSGTAGKPIFGQFLKYELSNVLVVVVRYFGGVLLGKGGLITAYRNATEEAIKNNQIIEIETKVNVLIESNETKLNPLMTELKKLQAEVYEINFIEEYQFKARINKKYLEDLKKFSLNKLTIID
ncbi:MAG: IMPACT family protein [Bacteroidota bacterium]